MPRAIETTRGRCTMTAIQIVRISIYSFHLLRFLLCFSYLLMARTVRSPSMHSQTIVEIAVENMAREANPARSGAIIQNRNRTNPSQFLIDY